MARKKREYKFNFEFYIKPKGSDEFINRNDMPAEEWNSYMAECVKNFGKTIENAIAGRPEVWEALEKDGTLLPIEGTG